MIVAVVAISAAIGFVVAAVVVGSVARTLGRQRREPVWRLAEAAAFVAQELPFDIAASLDAEGLEALLRAHLNQLQFGGQADPGSGAQGDAGAADDAAPERPPMGAVVTEDRSSAADLYRTLRRDGLEVSLDSVNAVAQAHLQYLRRIGAIAAVAVSG